MRLPDEIRVTVTYDGKPLADVLIQLSILTTFKNDFHLLFGPTGGNGTVIIRRDEMIRQALGHQQLFIKDFGDPEIHFSGELVLSIFGKEAIERAIDVYPDFKDSAEFPPDYLNQLHRAQEILTNLDAKQISLDVSYDPAGNVLVRVE